MPAILEIGGASGNPFIGKNSVQLDTLSSTNPSSRASFISFFPPAARLSPLSPSLPLTRSSVNRTTKRGDGKTSRNALSQLIHLIQECTFNVSRRSIFTLLTTRGPTIILHGTRFAPTYRPFAAHLLSSADGTGRNRKARLSSSSRPAPIMPCNFAEIQDFGLADDRQGARAHFFWAIGSTTPFPFLHDPQRKDLQIFHVVYATVALDGGAREEFRSILTTVQFGQ